MEIKPLRRMKPNRGTLYSRLYTSYFLLDISQRQNKHHDLKVLACWMEIWILLNGNSLIANGSQNFSRGNNIAFAAILPFLHIYINRKIPLSSIPLPIKLDCKSITKRTKTNSEVPRVFMVSKQWGMINVVNLSTRCLYCFLFILESFRQTVQPHPWIEPCSSSWKSCITPVPEPWTSTTSWPKRGLDWPRESYHVSTGFSRVKTFSRHLDRSTWTKFITETRRSFRVPIRERI